MEKEKFVIISHGRTGSTALMNWLNNLNSVRCHGEVFMRENYDDPDGFRYFCHQSSKGKLSFNTFLNPRFARYPINHLQDKVLVNYLHSLYYNNHHSGPWMTLEERGQYIINNKFDREVAVGFKLAYGALRGYAGIRRWLKRNNVKIVYLTRQNRLKKMLSWEMATSTKLFHSKTKTNVDTKITLDIDEFLIKLYNDQKLSALAEGIIGGLSNPTLNISYEKLFIEDSSGECSLLNSFLELKEDMYEKRNLSYTAKVNHDSIEKMVNNYDELYDKLKPTEFFRYLEV